MVETLWQLFLILGLVLLDIFVIFTIINYLYEVLIGSKKRKAKTEKAEQEFNKALEEFVEILADCLIENTEKCEKKQPKKTTKKESK